MAIIVTNANWLQVDGARLQKGKWDLTQTATGVRLSDSGERIDIPYSGTSIDGEEVGTVEELFSFFEVYGFRTGGGDGGGVAGVQSITGDGVSGSPSDRVISYPTPADIGAGTVAMQNLILADIASMGGEVNTKADKVISVTGTGALQGGGTLEANRTITATSATIASLAKADSAVQPDQLNAGLSSKADLVDGTVPDAQLPSYVDNIQEGTLATFPATGMSNIVYLDTGTNIAYRWGGSSYVEITSGGIALGETAATAYRGDRGKAAYDHSLVQTGNPHNVTPEEIGLGDIVERMVEAEGRLGTAEGRLDTIDGRMDGIDTELENKASLVEGKIPNEQLPDNIGGGSNSPISTSVINGVTHKEFSDRFEYTWKGRQTRPGSIGNHQYFRYNKAATFPISIWEADEFYISYDNENALIKPDIRLDVNNSVQVSFTLTFHGASSNVDVGYFLKLVKYK